MIDGGGRIVPALRMSPIIGRRLIQTGDVRTSKEFGELPFVYLV
jgi:hypothetical protein